jgi:hypothetical protein
MLTEVTDVGMKPKSPIFSHVSTASPKKKPLAGEFGRGDFRVTALVSASVDRNWECSTLSDQ